MKRGRLIAETLIGTDLDDPEYQEYLVTELSYGLGGSNFFTGQREPRGYFLHVLPEGRGQGMRRFTMFSGLKVLVSPANRFIQSTLDRLIPDPDLFRICPLTAVDTSSPRPGSKRFQRLI